MVTVPIDFEGHRFFFTAPPVVAGKAEADGVENVICRTLAHHLRPGATAIDVGANYGYVSMVLGSVVGSSGRVLSFEGDERIYQVLEATATRNHPNGSVQCVRALVGDGSDTVFGSTVGFDDFADGGASGVVDFGTVAAVKIDTDGDDFAVLRGMSQLIESNQPLVVVELAANEAEIVAWLELRYAHVVDMQGDPAAGPPWSPNVFAWNQPIEVQRRDRGRG